MLRRRCFVLASSFPIQKKLFCRLLAFYELCFCWLTSLSSLSVNLLRQTVLSKPEQGSQAPSIANSSGVLFMLTSTSQYVSPEVERLINQVIVDDARYDRDLRSVHREKVVLPVNLKFMNGLPSISAFSRNLSVSGACLITRQLIELDTTVMLQIYRLDGRTSQVVAECKWCKPFGQEYWMSGWQFLRLPKNL